MNEITLNSDQNSFDEKILKKKILVLVYFWAEWCQPCKRMSPIISEISSEMEGKLFISKLNVDENSNLVFKYDIRSIPSFLLFRNGERIAMKVGSFSKEKLKGFILEYLNSQIL